MKPVAAGAVERNGRWINEDTARLLEAAGRDLAEARGLHAGAAARAHGAAHRRRARRRAHLDAATGGGFRIAGGRGRVPGGRGRGGIPRAAERRCRHRPAWPASWGFPSCSWWACGWAASTTRCSPPRRSTTRACRSPAGSRTRSIPNMAAADENVAALVARLGAPLLGRLPFTKRGRRARARCPPRYGRAAPPVADDADARTRPKASRRRGRRARLASGGRRA